MPTFPHPAASPYRYIARQLSFASAEYQTEIIDLTPSQRAMYDNASLFWKELLGCFM